MNKCDFCGTVGGCTASACERAAERYMKAVIAKNSRTTTKNVNVKKNTHNTNHSSKNKKH